MYVHLQPRQMVAKSVTYATSNINFATGYALKRNKD